MKSCLKRTTVACICLEVTRWDLKSASVVVGMKTLSSISCAHLTNTTVSCYTPPSSGQHPNHDVCLKEKCKDYQKRYVWHGVRQLNSTCIHLYKQFLQVVKDWVLYHWDHSTVIRCVCMHSFLLHFIQYIICCMYGDVVLVGSGRPSSSFSAMTLLVGLFDMWNLLLTAERLSLKQPIMWRVYPTWLLFYAKLHVSDW